MDSNHRYRIRNNLFWLPPFGPTIRLPQQKPALSCRGPMVRIHPLQRRVRSELLPSRTLRDARSGRKLRVRGSFGNSFPTPRAHSAANNRRHPVCRAARQSVLHRLTLKVMNRGNRREALAIAQAVHIDHGACAGRHLRDCRDEHAATEPNCQTAPTPAPTACPAASSAGWRSPGRRSTRRRCCSPTSRRAISPKTARPTSSTSLSSCSAVTV